MADNLNLNAMSGGPPCATDEIGGVHYQRVKIGHGADGTFDDASSDAPLPTAVTSGESIGADVATVTTAGTPVRLGAHAALSVTVRARESNDGLIYVGPGSVTAANGYELAAGEAVSMDVANTNAVYVDAASNGDGVSYLWVAP